MATATGWSVDYILRKVNYQTLIMMLSDAPRYVRRQGRKIPEGGEKAEGGDSTVNKEAANKEAANIVSFFQSNLEA